MSLINAGLQGFARGAAIGIRVNVVSPAWVTETLIFMFHAHDGGGRPGDVKPAEARSDREVDRELAARTGRAIALWTEQALGRSTTFASRQNTVKIRS